MSWYHDTPRHDDILVGDTVLLPDGTHLDASTSHDTRVQGWEWFDTETQAWAALAPDAVRSVGAQPAVGLAAQVETLTAQVDALLTAQAGVDPEIAKVADIEAIRTAAEGSKGDDALVLAVAKALGADPAEVRKKRDADPQWFADVVAKYGLGGGKGDGAVSVDVVDVKP